MNVDLVHVIQKIDLDSGEMLNSILLRLPNGAEIRFRTRDPHLVTAVHRWFGRASTASKKLVD